MFSAENIRVRIEPIKEKIPKHVLKVIEEELAKLVMLESSSSCVESTYDYLDWLTMLPWGNFRFAFCFMITRHYDWEVSLIIIFIWLLQWWEFWYPKARKDSWQWSLRIISCKRENLRVYCREKTQRHFKRSRIFAFLLHSGLLKKSKLKVNVSNREGHMPLRATWSRQN